MATHVALLRGINVGGHNKVAMPALRQVVESVGARDVSTYIQSGNVVFSTDETDVPALTERLRGAIARQLGVSPDVVVLTAAELDDLIARNPYPDVTDGKQLHAVVLPEGLTAEQLRRVEDLQSRTRDAGGADEATVVGRVLYLRTPGGIGRSDLAARLTGRNGPVAAGTARNWSTVTTLARLAAG